MQLKINVSKVEPYKRLEVEADGIRIDLGLLNKEECRELAIQLDIAMYHLLSQEEYRNFER